jgi:hypothetical protein
LGTDESSTSFSRDCKKLGPETVVVCWGLLGWGEGRGEGGLLVDAVEVDTSVGA